MTLSISINDIMFEDASWISQISGPNGTRIRFDEISVRHKNVKLFNWKSQFF